MDLQNSPYKKKFLSPEDDWDLIYQEALAARKVLYEAKNKAYVRLQQLLTRRSLFYGISIILFTIGILFPSNEYLKSGDFQDYFYGLHSNWSILLIGASAIFYILSFFSKSALRTLEKEIKTAENILYELDHELFSRDNKQ